MQVDLYSTDKQKRSQSESWEIKYSTNPSVGPQNLRYNSLIIQEAYSVIAVLPHFIKQVTFIENQFT